MCVCTFEITNVQCSFCQNNISTSEEHFVSGNLSLPFRLGLHRWRRRRSTHFRITSFRSTSYVSIYLLPVECRFRNENNVIIAIDFPSSSSSSSSSKKKKIFIFMIMRLAIQRAKKKKKKSFRIKIQENGLWQLLKSSRIIHVMQRLSASILWEADYRTGNSSSQPFFINFYDLITKDPLRRVTMLANV